MFFDNYFCMMFSFGSTIGWRGMLVIMATFLEQISIRQKYGHHIWFYLISKNFVDYLTRIKTLDTSIVVHQSHIVFETL